MTIRPESIFTEGYGLHETKIIPVVAARLNGKSIQEIAREQNLHPQTIRRYINRLKEWTIK